MLNEFVYVLEREQKPKTMTKTQTIKNYMKTCDKCGVCLCSILC